MNAFTNYLEKLGNNFLVSAMVPSMAFVILFMFLLESLFGFTKSFEDTGSLYQLVGFSLIVFIPTVIVGFTLTALNTYILKIFEGYVTFFPIRSFYRKSQRVHLQQAERMRVQRERLRQAIREREEKSDFDSNKDPELEDLKDKYYQAAANYQLSYPENPVDVLPTRFGNTLKAAENYPGERYGFDGVHIWPRLVEVISKDYKASIDGVRNELSFLVNMSILLILFSFLCVVAMFISLADLTVISGDIKAFIEAVIRAAYYLLAAAGGFFIGGLFYKASILSVGSFGLMIRSSFDLFRKDLLKKLELKKPKNSIEEFQTWEELNEMIVLGNHSLTFTQIEYGEDQS